MPRPLDHVRRADLLSGVISYIAEYGLMELSLRPLAEYLGTSSRMLIHYFGTKEAMLVAALETLRPDIGALFADVDDRETLRTRLNSAFELNTSGGAATSLRVLLQVLGAACVPDSPFRDYAVAAVRVVVTSLSEALARIDPTLDDPESAATLLVSGMRGLIQDWWITRDTDRVERATRRLIDTAVSPRRAATEPDITPGAPIPQAEPR
ncbi:TetR/AcrR family transcriptional regulator [Nocardia uniformis]|uniref:TetR/AcrR family transcriptional regulator n=1 Tax=Nocardia uniformis TaxID=53432 RepID=A0A849C1Z9_9NOCA|nr:TetR/AcrR family transcriptional regulator [Nocardia uniformis]NNH69029.1 TetR/AcrR family transcriptional regulator [Nocardia uniformis]